MEESSNSSESSFQLVNGTKKKTNGVPVHNFEELSNSSESSLQGLKEKKIGIGRCQVSYHIPSIRKPQEEYNITVDNSNTPFRHVWLERSEDGSRFVHPMEKLSVLDFVDGHVKESVPVNLLPVEHTPFKLVEEVKELKLLATKLWDANEFAVDLEHNHYRSFQGLTCLMQISTRTEDFVIDTLKLHVHIGPYLREVFKDPSKIKVMHGADCDILWLQRDFGIYVCNLFDTGQASRVMQLERNSLEYLLRHFCTISTNKEYQNTDWRLRPLPDEMLKYAREDTHYLLHIYDLMKSWLLSMPSPGGNKETLLVGNKETLLVEVCKRSNEICTRLYEKELLSNSSFLHIYKLREANFNSEQLSIVSGLYKWRDNVARAEDESTGYILPNKVLLEIGKEVPLSSFKLRHLVKFKSPYVDCNLQSVMRVIESSIQNTSAFENIAELLKKGQQNVTYEQQNQAVGYGSASLLCVKDPMVSTVSENTLLHEKEQQQSLPLPKVGCFFKLYNTDDKITAEDCGSTKTKHSKSYKPTIVPTFKILEGVTDGFGIAQKNPSFNISLDCDEGLTNEQGLAESNSTDCINPATDVGMNLGDEAPCDPKDGRLQAEAELGSLRV